MTPRFMTAKGAGLASGQPYYIGHVQHDHAIVRMGLASLLGTQRDIVATKEIHDLLPDVKILILTSYGASDGIAHALAADASGALMKSTEFSEFVAALRKIMAGERVVAPEIARQLAAPPRSQN